MKKISLNHEYIFEFIKGEEINNFQKKVSECHNKIHNKSINGNYLGWVDLSSNYDEIEFCRLKIIAERIREQSQILIVIGIGGSYLGSKATIEMLNDFFIMKYLKIKQIIPRYTLQAIILVLII